MPTKDKGNFEPPADKRDLEERYKNNNASVRGNGAMGRSVDDEEARDFTLEADTSNYIGTSPEYMGYAQDADKPFPSEGVEGEVEKLFLKHLEACTPVPPKENEKSVRKESAPSQPSAPKSNS